MGDYADGAAVFALLVGFGAAVWARVKLDANDPAAWAWPMALALLCAPVMYPWYLLYFTPFLFTRAPTLPLTVWTFTAIPVYIVWEWARSGARWRVPAGSWRSNTARRRGGRDPCWRHAARSSAPGCRGRRSRLSGSRCREPMQAEPPR